MNFYHNLFIMQRLSLFSSFTLLLSNSVRFNKENKSQFFHVLFPLGIVFEIIRLIFIKSIFFLWLLCMKRKMSEHLQKYRFFEYLFNAFSEVKEKCKLAKFHTIPSQFFFSLTNKMNFFLLEFFPPPLHGILHIDINLTIKTSITQQERASENVGGARYYGTLLPSLPIRGFRCNPGVRIFRSVTMATHLLSKAHSQLQACEFLLTSQPFRS